MEKKKKAEVIWEESYSHISLLLQPFFPRSTRKAEESIFWGHSLACPCHAESKHILIKIHAYVSPHFRQPMF